jgi:ketosteroid isomerase-like protein
MKTKLTLAALILCMVLSAQKKKNGNIYIEHPAMEVVDEFNTAFVTGDLEKIKSLVSDDFKWRNSTMREKPGTLKQLLGRSNYLSKNIENFEIKHYGGSYPDAFEYKKDNVLDVMTYTWMTGYDKNTGVSLNMPRYASFRVAENGKILSMNIMDDQVLWNKAYDAYDTTRNGVIYKDHPLVSKVRLLMQSYLTKDVDTIKSHYTESTAFYDVMNSELNEYKTLEEEFADFSAYMEVFDLLEINESGYPDVLDYEGDGSVVISWWNMKFKNKKSGNITTIKQHIQHAFNEKGDISREDYYFNPAQLPD